MTVKPKERLLSLDAFRGLTIASMIMVNNPGSWSHLFRPLGHADWHGWTPTDWIFPFFLFIMGTAMAFSFGKKMSAGAKPKDFLGKIFSRSLIIFIIGLALNLNIRILRVVFHETIDNGLGEAIHAVFSQLRILGVLQRIAICYFVASLIIIYGKKSTRYLWVFLLFLVYTLILAFVRVPGEAAYELARGRNIIFYIDHLVLGNHMWTPANEPEGIVSTLPAIVCVLFGFFTGEWVRSEASKPAKLAGLIGGGLFLMMQGLLLDDFMPINKPLWTVSYTLFTSGLAMQYLGLCYFFIDMQGIKKWATPFLAFGSNAIVVFAGSSYVAATLALAQIGDTSIKNILYQNLFLSWLSDYNASFFYSFTYMVLWGIVAFILYRKKIFIRV